MAIDSWNATLYDQKHVFVSKFGEDVIDLLAPRKRENILDLGCGTGDLAERISKCGTNVIGVDQSENMINKARAKYPNIHFQVQDILQLDYSNEFDAVFSNATLHWVKQPEIALRNIHHALKPGGRFVAEFGGQGNVQTITDQLKKHLKVSENSDRYPWYFPSIGQYSALMEKVGFRVVFAHHFDRPTVLHGEDGLRNWIEMFASNMFIDMDTQAMVKTLESIEAEVKDKLYIDGKWVADYKRLRVIGIKQ
ncbi:class I SAM-dependent methyltransferase [Gracilibacillus dipsosauri]|uniref:class I SAM-dependent methyltransferase n=1 Tax=Gracilibacillus dipsosauri TaxID=178340 RepID=UPI00240A8D7D